MTEDKKTARNVPNQKLVGPHFMPLGPSKQVEVTLPKDLVVVLTQMAFSQLFGYAGVRDFPSVAEQCKKEVAEKIKPMPFLGFGKTTQKDKKGNDKMSRPADHGVELIEYCEECGNHHAENECPMRFESGYELARQERVLEAESDAWGDEVWF